MFRSSDGGATWQAIGLADTQQIGKILVDPRNPNVLLVAALGHPYGPNDERGVFRSTDGGRHWTKTLFKDANTGAIDMAFEPGNPNVVYAALWQTRRPPWNTYPPSNGPGSGLYKSTDGGRTWHQLVGHGLAGRAGRGSAWRPAPRIRAASTRWSTAPRPARAASIAPTIAARPGARSPATSASGNRGWYFGGITANPKNAEPGLGRPTRSCSARTTAARISSRSRAIRRATISTLCGSTPKNPDRRILGVDQGTLVTLNGGKTWSSWYNQPTAQFYHVSTDNRFPYRIYGSQQDSGAAAVAEPKRQLVRRHHHGASSRGHRRRRKRRDRARSRRSRHRLWRHASIGSTSSRARREASIRRSPSPTNIAASGRCR